MRGVPSQAAAKASAVQRTTHLQAVSRPEAPLMNMDGLSAHRECQVTTMVG